MRARPTAITAVLGGRSRVLLGLQDVLESIRTLLMPDCFISYSSQDQRVASAVRDELQRHGLNVFMASASLKAGDHWSAEILGSLKNSKWVIFLASRPACSSSFVNQEVGGALLDSKHLVPIVWDIAPSEFPGWASRVQAIELRDSKMADWQAQIGSIAGQIKQEKAQGLLILGAIVFALLAFGKS